MVATDRLAWGRGYPRAGQVGSAIRGQDGQLVGDLRKLAFETATGDVIGIIVRLHAGPVFTEDVELPATLITDVGDDVIVVGVDRDWVRDWARVGTGQTVWTRDGLRLGTVARRLVDSLEVVSPAQAHRLRVPLTAVARLDGDRVVLTADAAQAAHWERRSGIEPW